VVLTPIRCPAGRRWAAPLYLEKLDTWLVENDEQIGHPRDRFHRLDARRSSRHVTVRAGGAVVGDTRNSVAVFETGLPVRWYVPQAYMREAPSYTVDLEGPIRGGSGIG
jgi:hypothetical protein